MDPVHCNALWCLNAAVNHHSVVRRVTGHVKLGAVRKEIRVERLTLDREIALQSSLLS